MFPCYYMYIDVFRMFKIVDHKMLPAAKDFLKICINFEI